MFAWTEAYSVKVAELDNQHKQLFSLLEELHQAMKTGQTNTKLGIILEGLIKYTRNHFASEEKALVAARYPNYRAHKSEHDAFTTKVEQTIADFKANKIGISIDLMEFLSSWLVNHIQKSDMQYSSYLA